MTSPRRFEQDLPALLADLYVGGLPDYRDDIVLTTAATRQRPAWTFPERWIPMDVAMRRLPVARLPWRTLAIAALIAILAAAAVFVAGSRQRVPPPFGPAANGPIAYSVNGQILVRDSFAAGTRVIIDGPGAAFPTFSPDGTKVLFSRTTNGEEILYVAAADGTSERRVFDQPLRNAAATWSPDSRTIALETDLDYVPELQMVNAPALLIVNADGSGSRRLDLAPLRPSDVVFRPPDGATMLVRARVDTGQQDLYLMNADGSNRRALGIPSPLLFGPDWDVSGATYSPSGDRIAFNAVEADPVSGYQHFRVHLRQPDGSGDVEVASPNAYIQEAWPAYSPDGKWILVHRWQWKADGGKGWLAVLPADGSTVGRDIGPKVDGGEDTGLTKAWSPDGTKVLVRADNTKQLFSIDPTTGAYEELPWGSMDLPNVRRMAP
jgi:Tol biopolymer transport system component